MKKVFVIFTGGNEAIAAEIAKEFVKGGWMDNHPGQNLDSNWIELSEGRVWSVYGAAECPSNARELTLYDVFENKEEWERPTTKEMTVAEISDELGYDVKVVR